MEGLQYRGKARIVAIVDLVLVSITACLPTMLLYFTVAETLYAAELRSEPETMREYVGFSVSEKESFGAILIMLWILSILTLMTVVIQMIIAKKLLNTTQIGVDPKKIPGPARLWRRLTFLFAVLSIRFIVIHFNMINLMFFIPAFIFRCVGLGIVTIFIQEAVAADVQTLPTHQTQAHEDGAISGGDQVAVGFIANDGAGDNGPPASL